MSNSPIRRRDFLALSVAGLTLAATPALRAQELTFFRIGTGSTGETHFPIGGVIANAISNPPGSRECEKGGSCGVPGLIAVAQSTHGSVANIEAIAEGRLEAALAQADVAYWAFHGSGPYKKKGAIANLRSIAMLYPDSMHLVTRAESDIHAIADLKGKRVSLGETGSGTQVEVRNLLNAFGVKERDLKTQFLKAGPAADALAKGELDAFFVVDGAPVPSIAELARSLPIRLLPIEGAPVERLREAHPFLQQGAIPAGAYKGLESAVPTLDVPVVLLVGAEVPADLVYGVTRALWHPSTQKLLAQSHPRGKLIRLEAAAEKLGIQLHAGAASYYFDAGLLH